MRPEKQQMSRRAGRPPTKQDRVFVLLTSLGFFVGLIPLVCLIQGPVLDRVVILLVMGLPVVIINALFPFSWWETPSSPDGSPTTQGQSRDVSGGEAKEDSQ